MFSFLDHWPLCRKKWLKALLSAYWQNIIIDLSRGGKKGEKKRKVMNSSPFCVKNYEMCWRPISNMLVIKAKFAIIMHFSRSLRNYYKELACSEWHKSQHEIQGKVGDFSVCVVWEQFVLTDFALSFVYKRIKDTVCRAAGSQSSFII